MPSKCDILLEVQRIEKHPGRRQIRALAIRVLQDYNWNFLRGLGSEFQVWQDRLRADSRDKKVGDEQSVEILMSELQDAALCSEINGGFISRGGGNQRGQRGRGRGQRGGRNSAASDRDKDKNNDEAPKCATCSTQGRKEATCFYLHPDLAHEGWKGSDSVLKKICR